MCAVSQKEQFQGFLGLPAIVTEGHFRKKDAVSCLAKAAFLHSVQAPR